MMKQSRGIRNNNPNNIDYNKTLGVSVDYDESILLDAEANCATLYAELSTTLSNLNV